MLQYSVSIQQELRHGIFLEVSYVGNQGRHLVRQPNINVPTFAVAAANVGKTTNQERPYLGYADITQFRGDADSKYNALQIYVTKRKGNLNATISYTYSKAQGDASGINDNPEPECPLTCQLADGSTVSCRCFTRTRVVFVITIATLLLSLTILLVAIGRSLVE